MKKPEIEVIQLSEEMFTSISCPAICVQDCDPVGLCMGECVGYDPFNCPWNE
jgi:hypothetical protein